MIGYFFARTTFDPANPGHRKEGGTVKLKAVIACALLCLSMMFLARESSAQEEVRPLEPDWLQQMYADGWEKVQEGVLRRDIGEGKIESFAYGAEGSQWVIERFRQKLTQLEGEYLESPTDELASLVDQLTNKINSLQDDALAAPAADYSNEGQEGCSYYRMEADAGPQTSAQGVTASASAYLESTCETGDTFAYAHAKARVGTLLTDLEKFDDDSGSQVLSQAIASAEGSQECFSEAMATVTLPGGTHMLEPYPQNYDCPDVVLISGPAQVATDYYGQACADVTWIASASSGRTDYTFEWYIGTALEGTGTTLTKRYCNEAKNETVRVVARDGAAWSDDETFTTRIQNTPAVVASASGPASVTTDYYSSPCATVTWTAGATGGHPGYTYNWYIGTGSTVQGTGSTFSKQYCNTSQSVTIKAVAQDSDGHTANATYTTNIQYTGQLTASVTGPSTATVDYYGPCTNVTWTASAANGHPGYTYNWYLGTGTTSQGTGNTFTKSYCPTTNQSVTVKAIATDSDGHTATSATFTTNVNTTPAIVAKITGPATAYLNPSCVDVTWTGSASGSGHSGYTYKWYLGTSTTLQGSGSTFTKRYCSATTATVKLVATASDNHASEVTFTTKITPPPAPTVSISGPAEVTVAGGTCTSVTWTANVSGGTPAYTYSWTIGTSTTVLSTASSLTKSICVGTTDVKVTVRDAASQTSSATFSTTVTRELACYMPNCTY